MQGTIAGQSQIAPAPQPSIASRTLPVTQPSQPELTTLHFDGRIADLKIYREAQSADQIKAAFDARPDFSLPTWQEASPHWPVQIRGQSGMSEPQDPSTLPRSKAPFSRPVAQPVSAAELHDQLAGDNPWELRGGWRMAPAPQVKARGEKISRPGFDAKDWLVATVPGTALTRW